MMVAVLLAFLSLGSSALAADATGTWTWTVQRGDNTIEQTLKLKQDGEKLTGTISGRQGGETEIEDGKVSEDTITFKVTREFNGNRFVISYQGKVDDETIKGEISFDRQGETVKRPWEAKRAE
ncbi:hypothetical protein TsocGM_08210 [Tautonia sociabilis]|uniref:Uncharacterized protein n=2 Tax=Tautonia sociabilis TaxID=2080755 RepID=A0A432MMB6_9BACT|nr:hypothetical protein TsocGM_08210 [Tautonia sociabilis]